MPNEIENYDATVESRIDDKVDIYSITAEDVGGTIREGVALGAIINILDPSGPKTYPKGWRGVDADFNLYIAKLEDVSGDYSITANWKVVGGGGGSGNTTTSIALIECDGTNTDYTVVNPLNNPDVVITVRYNNSSPYGVFYPPVTISAGFAVVDLSSVPIDVFNSYKVIFSGQDLS